MPCRRSTLEDITLSHFIYRLAYGTGLLGRVSCMPREATGYDNDLWNHESQQVRKLREDGLLGYGTFPRIYVTLEVVDAQQGNNAVDNAA